MPGVFVAGDVRAQSVKRVASAVGEGALAVTLVHRYLAEQLRNRLRNPLMPELDTRPGSAPDELRTLFLFEALDDDQLAWLSEHGRVRDPGRRHAGLQPRARRRPASSCCCPAPWRCTGRSRAPTSRRCGPTSAGVYSGATQAFVQTEEQHRYPTSACGPITDCEFWVIDAGEFGDKIREWFPMAMHMLEGMAIGHAVQPGASSASGSGCCPWAGCRPG